MSLSPQTKKVTMAQIDWNNVRLTALTTAAG
jgi:hypothetical protein